MEASTWLTFSTFVWCSTWGVLSPTDTVQMDASESQLVLIRETQTPQACSRTDQDIWEVKLAHPSSSHSLCCNWSWRSQFSKRVWVHYLTFGTQGMAGMSPWCLQRDRESWRIPGSLCAQASLAAGAGLGAAQGTLLPGKAVQTHWKWDLLLQNLGWLWGGMCQCGMWDPHTLNSGTDNVNFWKMELF